HYPCDTYNYPLACYRNIIYHIRKETQMQLKEVVNECLKQKGKQRLGCFHGLGFSYSRMIGEKPLLIRAVCQRGNREERLVCIEGAIEKLADFNEEQALKICNALRGEDKEVCVLAAKEKMYRTDKPLIDLYVK
ncbi:MAG: hypothetical protein ACR2NC_00480, partial [Thermodesulfobacteriota bacterium]